MALTKTGFIPIPPGKQPGFDHAGVYRRGAPVALFVATGSPGVISVIDERRLETIEAVPSESGSHTIGWNPDTRTLYAFLPASSGASVFVEQ
jgi:DNA-binding beta-propeller fold protein YncE